MQRANSASDRNRDSIEIHPGALHLPGFLTLNEQIKLVRQCEAIGRARAGFYKPAVRGGAYMSIEMVCLGRHWNAKTYKYEATRSDYDGLPVQELPEELKEEARRAAREAGMQIEPDICLINRYPESGRLGVHQDKDERPETIAAGVPVVSISLGDTAKFWIGGLKRKDPLLTVLLESGDAFVMGGPSRLRYHGVSRILAGTAPSELGMTGRFNLTFRQY
jgi:alkylated DNA repair protein (DNA oxidative demethylase)